MSFHKTMTFPYNVQNHLIVNGSDQCSVFVCLLVCLFVCLFLGVGTFSAVIHLQTRGLVLTGKHVREVACPHFIEWKFIQPTRNAAFTGRRSFPLRRSAVNSHSVPRLRGLSALCLSETLKFIGVNLRCSPFEGLRSSISANSAPRSWPSSAVKVWDL